MQRPRLRSITRSPWRAAVLAASGLYACSFQDFDYLKNQAGVGVGGTVDEGGSSGQIGTTGGATETGGKPSFGGTGGGHFEMAGEAGSGGAVVGGGGGVGGDARSDAGSGGIEQGGAGESGGADSGGSPGSGGSGNEPVGGTAGTGGTGGTVTGPVLANASFEQGLAGWTVDPADAAAKRHVYTQAPTSGSTTVDGGTLLATWHDLDEYEVYVFQTLTGLEDGNYSFKGNFSSTQSRGAYLFARNCGGADRQETVLTTQFTWFEVALHGIEVTGGTCEVGFFVHNIAKDWLNADMFTFERDVE